MNNLTFTALNNMLSKKILATMILLFSVFQTFGQDSISIYLCIGQSNMAGRAEIPENLSESPIDGVLLLNDKDAFEPAQNPLNRYSTIRKDISMQRLSIAWSFARKMSESTDGTIGLVCNARGETSVHHWQKGADRGYYEEAVRRTKEAMKHGELKGIIWHQGEYDCTSDLEEYRTLLSKLICDLRNEFGIPGLPVVVGQISQWNWTDSETGTAPFNNMIVNVENFIPNSACALSEGLSPEIGVHDPHFSAEGQITFGERYAECMIKLLNGHPGDQNTESNRQAN